MDRTGWIVVLLCTIALVYLFNDTAKRAAEAQKQQRDKAAAEATESQSNDAEGGPEETNGAETVVKPAEPAPVPEPNMPLEEMRLESDEAVFQFTHHGGGIENVILPNHLGLKKEGPIVINQDGLAPIGAIARRDRIADAPITYDVSKPEDGKIVFTGVNPLTKIQITKTFTQSSDPYLLDVEVELKNVSDVRHESSDYYFHTGALSYLHEKEMSLYLAFNWDDGETHKETVQDFKGGGFIFKKAPRNVIEEQVDGLRWAGPCNQFFASLVIPQEEESRRVWMRRTPVTLADAPDAKPDKFYALYGAVAFPEILLDPGGANKYQFQVYTGPRELKRLEAIGHGLKGVMHYDDMPIFGGMFGLIPLISSTLLKLMVWLQSFVHNWGVAILIITCLIRLLIWPLHAKSTRTMKRMAKLAPMMQELKEKHSDDPQKMQQETMKLYRDYGVNPLGGCFPIFLQLPIFLGFYKMLQSAVELRHQDFLWVKDLSMPDAIYHFQNFSLFGISSINLMPLLMAATMILQMQIGPKAGDKMQQRIFMFMPIIFLFICYNFASALALYWTGQNIFSIGQTWLMNRRPEPELKKRPPRQRISLEDLKRPPSPGQKPKKPKKRAPRTGG